jgi:hypothetical protein
MERSGSLRLRSMPELRRDGVEASGCCAQHVSPSPGLDQRYSTLQRAGGEVGLA